MLVVFFYMARFSIITVTYNSSSTLKDTIESVLKQSYSPFEYIIVDGMSTDNTVEIAKSYNGLFARKGIELRIISERDSGLYDAMNKGIKLAQGDVVGIINSDDWYEYDALESANLVLKNEPQVDIVHAQVRRYRHDGYSYLMGGKDIRRLKYYMCLNHPTFFVRKRVYDDLGMFKLKYRSSADYDFALRTWLKGCRYYKIDKILANMRLGGFSDINYKLGLREKKEIQLSNGINKYVVILTYFVFIIKHEIVNFLVKHDINYQRIIKRKV